MQISVVIPTCNRKSRLLALLGNLDRSTYPLREVIIVDSGDDRLSPADYSSFTNLDIQYRAAQRSVCIQRNAGIRMAGSPWIFLCDDDIEVPPGYLEALVKHIQSHPLAGAVSGQWLEKENGNWKAHFPLHSTPMLLWTYFFQLGIWGEITCNSQHSFARRVKRYYQGKGNHISKAGWPVNTDFSGDYSICPVYSLGASLVKKEWLLHSPYDEVLDRHGIGDNYGVALGFPVPGIHIVNSAFVYHHHEEGHRLKRSLQYYRRALALDYFVQLKPALTHIKRYRIAWSLVGNLLRFLRAGDGIMAQASVKAIWKIMSGSNPYMIASRKNSKVIEPML